MQAPHFVVVADANGEFNGLPFKHAHLDAPSVFIMKLFIIIFCFYWKQLLLFVEDLGAFGFDVADAENIVGGGPDAYCDGWACGFF